MYEEMMMWGATLEDLMREAEITLEDLEEFFEEKEV